MNLLNEIKTRWPISLGIAIALAIVIVIAARSFGGPRTPPNIFDSPVDGVLGFLGDADFNAMSIDERLRFLQDVIKRFASMSQTESAIAAAFLAGLSGPAAEQLTQNARVLGKDIMVRGAVDFLALKTDAERREFLDEWVVGWVRYAEESTGRKSQRSDEEILARLSKDARRDVERNGAEISKEIAFAMMDFWERDVASVANPAEQARLFQFLPALRDHILNRK